MLIVRHGLALGHLKISVLDESFAILHRDVPVPVARYGDFSASVAGSCNGLLCVQYGTGKSAFWNPATKQFAWVPVRDLGSPYSHVTRFVAIGERFGFGFSTRNEDYKLVKFASFYYKEWNSEDQVIWEDLEVKAVVFSWKRWSWRELKDARIPAAHYDHPVAANGHLYWLARRKGTRDFILAFDLATDSFRTIDFPADDPRPDGAGSLMRFDMDTRIAVFKSYLDYSTRYDDEDDLEAVVIGENGMDLSGETWEFMFRCGWFDGYDIHREDEGCFGVYWNSRVHVVKARGRNMDNLYLFDPVASKAVRRFDGLMGRVYGVGSFVHSLVPVRGGNV
ncbi:unnamed protein product [Linum tenue]|nr:unnamed protein product [Linum tenue]